MYVREIEGREVELGVSGRLWRDALVMYDRRTGSLWSQIDGRAILGPAEGQRLEEVERLKSTLESERNQTCYYRNANEQTGRRLAAQKGVTTKLKKRSATV